MGQPVRILDLAEQLIRLSGLEPYKDVQIQFTGLRPGEKLNEELTGDGEDSVPTGAERIRLVERNGRDGAGVAIGLERLMTTLTTSAHDELLSAVVALVPEYTPERQPRRSPPLGTRRPSLTRTSRGNLVTQRPLLGDAPGA
jgi:FlaA1/EpsC-like NDP-sugar epimerase